VQWPEKWLQLLKEVAPKIKRVAVPYTPAGPAQPMYLRSIDAAAMTLAIDMTAVSTGDSTEITRGIDTLAQKADGGLVVLSAPSNAIHRDQIMSLAVRHRLPAIYPGRYYAGGVVSYGPDLVAQYRRAASYVDRILMGEKAGSAGAYQV